MRSKNKDKELNHRHFIGLRLTDVELDLLDQGAACLSISRSEYLRKLLLEKQINHQIEVVADMNDLRFEHDEKTGKKIVDESGRSILRKEFCIWHRNTASKNWMRSIYCYRSDQRNHIP